MTNAKKTQTMLKATWLLPEPVSHGHRDYHGKD